MKIYIFNRDYPLSVLDSLKKDVARSILKPKRTFNFISSKLKWFLRKDAGMPLSIMIEPTGRCNLDCPMCGRKQMELMGIERKKGDMTLGSFKKVIDEIKDYVFAVFLWNYGEPLLNKDFIKMVEYAKKKDLICVTSTNGTLITDAIAKNLVQLGLSYLILSVDGPNKEIYNIYRKNGDFEKVINGIKKVIEYKKILKKKTPIVDLQFIVMKKNAGYIKEMENLGKRLGVDLIIFKKCQIGVEELKDEFLPLNKEFLFNSEQNYNRRICYKPFEHSVINWNGDVFPCCDTLDQRWCMGNIFKENFRSIWYGEKYEKFREKILSNISAIPICKICQNKATFEKTHTGI